MSFYEFSVSFSSNDGYELKETLQSFSGGSSELLNIYGQMLSNADWANDENK